MKLIVLNAAGLGVLKPSAVKVLVWAGQGLAVAASRGMHGCRVGLAGRLLFRPRQHCVRVSEIRRRAEQEEASTHAPCQTEVATSAAAASTPPFMLDN